MISNTTIAAGGIIHRPPRRSDDSDDPAGPGGPGGRGGSGSQHPEYHPAPSPWITYRGTQNQFGRPTLVTSAGDEESNGPGDGSVRRIMASVNDYSESEREIFYKDQGATYSKN